MNNLNHISEILKKNLGVKILKFFDADPVSGMEKYRIRDKHPGSAKLDLAMQTGPQRIPSY
jgi:hypothetical protein